MSIKQLLEMGLRLSGLYITLFIYKRRGPSGPLFLPKIRFLALVKKYILIYNIITFIPEIEEFFILKYMEAKLIKDNDLDKKSIEEIKANLIQQKNQILKEMGQIAEKNGGNSRVKFPDYGNKVDENAQEIDEYTKNLATEKVLESTLRDIENALNRIEKGNYGICKYCKKPIGKKRLLARPVASACVTCKTKLQNSI